MKLRAANMAASLIRLHGPRLRRILEDVRDRICGDKDEDR
jgi:hypothetical protein